MPDITFQVVQGPRTIQSIFDEIFDRAAHLKPALDNVADEVVLPSNARNIAAAAMIPLAPRTIRERIALGYPPGPPLVRSGALFFAAVERGAPGNIINATDDALEVGIDPGVIPYAAVHQRGLKGIPRRVIMMLSASDIEEIGDKLGAYVADGTLTTSGINQAVSIG